MNQERTYGIELEFGCKVSIPELTSQLNAAFTAAGSNHRAIGTGYYHHNTDGNNYQNWDVKTDSSIQAPDINSNYPYGIEIASPVLKGDDGLAALKIVTDVLSNIANVGKTTGLHVHHGVRATEMKNIAKSWNRIQDAIYLMIPASRRNNRFCAKWVSHYNGAGDLRHWYRNNIGTRYVGLNLESYWIRGTVEFRMAAGSIDYEKISNWAIYTQLLIDNASKIAASTTNLNHGEISDLLSRVVTVNGDSPNLSPNIPHSEPRPFTKNHLMWKMVNQGHSLEDIRDAVIAQYGSQGIKQSEYRIKLLLAAKNTSSTVSTATITDTLNANAIAWATTRYNKFNVAA